MSLNQTRRFKVLQLHPDYNIKARDFADLGEQILKALPVERYQTVTAFLRGKPAPGQPESRAEQSVYFEFTDAQLKGMRLRAMWQLYRYCAKEKFDVVICNRFKPVSMMLTLNRWLKIPLCIGIAHGFGEYERSYRRRHIARLVNQAWYFVGVSSAVRQYLLDCCCGFTEKNTITIANAIDVAQAKSLQLTREEARQQLGLDPNARFIGAIGRLVPVKGHIYLIHAFAQIAHEYPDAQLAIIGDGREKEHLLQEIKQLNLTGRIHLLGFHENALRFVHAFDIWAMPSLSEGLSLAQMEGMSGHLPTIGTSIPAMLPLIEGSGGIAVPPADTTALSQALSEYLKLSDAALTQKGEQAYNYLIKHHDIESFRHQYLTLIESGLQQASLNP
jgi:glycosyltransferase involved in cell wall biosynthesis